ncbi:hypothetical protein ACP4OV_008964 [Aristida adscensionis]
MEQPRVASILLLMLSLEALLAVASPGIAPASGAGGDITLRLPSDTTGKGFGDHVTMTRARTMPGDGGGNKEWPWKCCDTLYCRTNVYPFRCQCLDVTEQCWDACNDCRKLEDGSGRYVCADWYECEEDPEMPQCSKDTHGVRGGNN